MSVTVSASDIGSEGISLLPGATVLKLPKNVPEASVIGDMWKKVGSGISATQSVLNQGLPTEQWTGAAADAAASEIKTLGGKLSTLATAFPGPAGDLNTWETNVQSTVNRVKGYQQEWDGAVAKYNQEIRRISDAKAANSDYDPEPEQNAAIANLRRTQQSLRAMYKVDLQFLDQQAHWVAGRVRASVDSIVTPDVVKGGRDAIGVALCTSMPIASGAAQWAAAQHEAPQMTADLSAAANSKVPLTQAQINALQAKYGDKLQNPFYVQAMIAYYRMKHGGKDGNFTDMMNRLLLNTSGTYPPVPGEVATRNAFVGTLGTALVLSTGGTNVSGRHMTTISEAFEKSKGMLRGPDGKTTIEQIENTNIAEIEAVGRKTYIYGSRAINGYDLFTQSSAYAGEKNPDLVFGRKVYEGGNDSLATKLVNYDHECRAKNGAANGVANGVDWNQVLSYRPEEKFLFEHCKDPLQSLFVLSDTPDSMQVEGFAAKRPDLVIAEQARLRSLRSFLSQDTSFTLSGDWDGDAAKTVEKVPICRYLSGNRYSLHGFSGFTDGGDAFGKMIVDVTQPIDETTAGILGKGFDPQMTANEQVGIVGNFVAGYQDALGHDDGLDVKDPHSFGALNPKLRSYAGQVVSNWIDSFTTDGTDDAANPHVNSRQSAGTGLSDPADDATGTTRLPAHFTLSKGLFNSLFQQDGFFADLALDNPKQIAGSETPNDPFDDKFEGGRPPAMRLIQTAAYARYREDLGTAMGAPSDYWAESVKTPVEKWKALFKHVEDATVHLGEVEHKRIVADNTLIRKGIDALWQAIPFSKVPGGKIPELIISTIASDGKSDLLNRLLPTDFSSQDYAAALNGAHEANSIVADTLTDTFVARDEWPNAAHKSKAELVAEFLEEERHQAYGEGVKATATGGLPSYMSMNEDQQSRLRKFLARHTYLKGALGAVSTEQLVNFSKPK